MGSLMRALPSSRSGGKCLGDKGLRPDGEEKKLENLAFCLSVVSGLARLALLPADSDQLAALLGTN